MVILYTYSANLIAFLTVEKKTTPFETLQQLLIQSEYIFGVLDNTILAMLFKVRINSSSHSPSGDHQN